MKFLNNLDLQKNEIQNFRVQNLAAAPSNPVVGQHYYNTTDNTEYVWNGTKWIDALSQGDYTFTNGIVEEGRTVGLTAATSESIGGVIIGSNIDVNNGTISVKDATNAQKGLIQLATDAEATAGENETKAINAKQLATAIDGDIELTDLSIDAGSTNYLTYNNTNGKFGAKVDTAPTENSTNLITSGGVFANEVSAVQAKAETTDTIQVTKAGTTTDIKISKVEAAVLADTATADADGNVIKTTYATKAEVADNITLNDLSATGPITYDNTTGVISANYDVVPTANSNNLVKSGDIKTALDGVTNNAVKNVALKSETTDTLVVTKGDDTSADIKIAKVDEAATLTGVTASAAELNILDGATLDVNELNVLDGITATTAELNILDGVTADKDEINILDGVTATTDDINKLDGLTATQAELNELHEGGAVTADFVKLHGLTSTAAEINELHESGVVKADLTKLHNVTVTADQINAVAEVDAEDLAKLADITATAEEINILDGATLSTEELNILDGATVTTAELNVLDGITATTAQLNRAADLDEVTQADLTKLHDVTVSAADLNKINDKLEADDISATAPITYDSATGTISATYDNAPTDNSDNLVKSGAIKAALDDKVDVSLLGVANGVATLDAEGLVPAAQLPSYVDDVIELVAVQAAAPATCAKGDRYFNTTDNKVYTATAAIATILTHIKTIKLLSIYSPL